MTVQFGFKHEGKNKHLLALPANLFAAYYYAISKKRRNSLLFLICMLLSMFFVVNSLYCFLPVFNGEGWKILFTLLFGVSFVFFLLNVTWNGPKSILIFSVLSIENFEEYINYFIGEIEKIISPISRAVTFLPEREVKNIEKELATAQLFKDLYIETKDMEDIFDAINMISLSCENKIHYFSVKRYKNKKYKNVK